jgi:hypothetical protein
MSTETTATDVAVTDEVAAALAEQKAKIIDAAVREARANSWCGEFERVLRRIFPEGSGQPEGDWYDSDGVSCRGYDTEGFHVETGLNRAGFDRDGYNRNGRNAQGYDHGGLDTQGFNRDGLHVATGITRDSDEYRARFKWDHRGLDFEGFDASGYDPNGSTREQRARACVYDEDGYNINGRDRYGYTREQNGGGRGQ